MAGDAFPAVDRSRYLYARVISARRWLAKRRVPEWVVEEWRLDYHEFDGRGCIGWVYPELTVIDWESRTWTVYDPCALKPKDIIPLCQLIAATKAWLDPAVWQSRSEREFTIEAEWTSLERKFVDLEIRQQKNREIGEKGNRTRQDDANERHADIIKKAKSLLAQGTHRRDLTAELEPHLDVSNRQLRRILKKAKI